MRLRALLPLIAMVAGCDYVFHVEEVPATTDDASPDTALDAAGEVAPCSAMLDERFLDTSPCSLDGNGSLQLDNGAMATQGAGKLTITPAFGMTSSAGHCFTRNQVPLTSNGIMVAVAEAIGGQGNYTTLTLGSANLTISSDGVNLTFQNAAGTSQYASKPYDQAAMRWWRYRQVGADVVADYSADLVTWKALGMHTVSVSSTIVALHAGLHDKTGSGQAVYERLIICN